MTTDYTANRRIVLNLHPAVSTISENLPLDERLDGYEGLYRDGVSIISDNLRPDEKPSPVCSGRPNFPLAIWTPPIAPVMMGDGEIWARSVIEMMFAADRPITSICPGLEEVGSPKQPLKRIIYL